MRREQDPRSGRAAVISVASWPFVIRCESRQDRRRMAADVLMQTP